MISTWRSFLNLRDTKLGPPPSQVIHNTLKVLATATLLLTKRKNETNVFWRCKMLHCKVVEKLSLVSNKTRRNWVALTPMYTCAIFLKEQPKATFMPFSKLLERFCPASSMFSRMDPQEASLMYNSKNLKKLKMRSIRWMASSSGDPLSVWQFMLKKMRVRLTKYSLICSCKVSKLELQKKISLKCSKFLVK